MEQFFFRSAGFESGLNTASAATRQFYDRYNKNGNGRFMAGFDGKNLYLFAYDGTELKSSHVVSVEVNGNYAKVTTLNSIIQLWNHT